MKNRLNFDMLMKQNACYLFNTRYILLLFSIVLCSPNLKAQQETKGKDFWFGFMYNLVEDAPLEVYVTAERIVSGTVTIPGTGFSQTFNVPANSTAGISIPNAVMAAAASDIKEAKAIHITTCDTVSVYAINKGAYSDDASVIYATPALGSEYRVLTKQGNPGDWGKEFLIVATENNTLVEIVPSASTDAGHPAGVPYMVTLNQGDMYQVTSGGDLTGTTVKSVANGNTQCSRFAVFAGSKCINIGGCNACDHLYEQLMPVSAWGKEFIVGSYAQKGSLVYRVLANLNNTAFTVNNGPPISLNAGQFYEYSSVSSGGGISYISSNNPVLVMEYMTGSDCDGGIGDPDEVLISPLEQTMKVATFYTIPSPAVTSFYANILTKTSSINQITLNGAPIPPTSFATVPSNPQYAYATGIGLNQSTNYQLKSDSGFFAFVYGIGNYESYSYPVGSSVKDLYSDFTIQKPPSVCAGSTFTFHAVADPNSNAYQWDYGDGTTGSGLVSTHAYLSSGTYTVQLTKNQLNSCNKTVIKQLAIPSLSVNIHGPNNSICPGQAVSLNIPVQDTITIVNHTLCGGTYTTQIISKADSIVWSTGDTSRTITVAPWVTTTYYVHAYVRGALCEAVDSITVQVNKPIADFNLSNTCLNIPASFTNTSSSVSTIASYVWHFGDGNVGSGSNPSHTYPAPGTYSTQLIITNIDLCKDSITKTITVFPVPSISFTANPVCLNVPTSFTNTSGVSSGSIMQWEWDFTNDGITDNTTQNPANIYPAPGTYTVELKATTDNGCRDSSMMNVLINALPTASFTSVNACVNFNIGLTDNSSVPAPATVHTYNWSFGTGANPPASSNQNPPSLIYNTPGIKTIALTVTASTSCTASTTQTVQVYPQPVANFSSSSVCQATATAFTDLSTCTVGSVNGWQWDLQNDGAIDNTSNAPSFTYPASGTYTAALIATSSFGCKDTVLFPVNVWGHTIPDFTPDKVCFGTATTFSNLTNTTSNANVGGTPSYSWDFTDGSLSNAINPVHTFILNGNANASYNVLLVATSTHNCVDSIRKQVSVFALPAASFTSDSVCLGSASHMVDASNGNGNTVNTYEWDFLNDGLVDVSGVPGPNYVFPNYGNNAVSYTVSTSPVVGLVCKNTTNSLTVWVNPNPVPDFSFVNKCINAQPNSFDASASSIGVGTNTNYAWAYGDGSTDNGLSVAHAYTAPSVYNVTLTVTSDKGCQKKITKQTEVFPKPLMTIANSDACDRKVMSFTATTLPNSGNVTAWFWDFNHTITSFEATGYTAGYTFPAAGNQTVALVTETDKGCRDTVYKNVYVDYVPVPKFTVNKQAACPLHCVTFSDNTPAITGPAQNISWSWSFGDGYTTVANNGSAQHHCYNNTTSNELKTFDIKLVVVTDKGCTDSIEKSVFITVYPEPVAAYGADPNPGNVATPMVYFNNLSRDYTKWWWNFGDSPARDSINKNPEHFYYDASAKTYASYLIVANQYGCRDTAYLKVEIGPEFTFYIPNAFSPNMDGTNEYFTGKGIGIETYEMWVFDRWGEMIFYSDDIAKGWDGKRQGKGQDCKQDVYVWKVKLKDVLGKNHTYTGHVTLIR